MQKPQILSRSHQAVIGVTVMIAAGAAGYFYKPYQEFEYVGAKEEQRQGTHFVHAEHPALQANLWKTTLEKPLEEKLIVAPDALLDFIGKDNEVQGWPQRPRAVEIEPEFESDLIAALRELPKPVREKIESSLAFITVVEDLGGSAYSEFLVDSAKNRLPLGFIVIDRTALSRKANEWATWKESSPFAPDESYRLIATIEPEKTNSRKQALQFILLHEMGHVLHYTIPGFPVPGEKPEIPEGATASGFPSFSWKVERGEIRWRSAAAAEFLPEVHYYAAPEKRISIRNARRIYEALASTDFPTLYAATNLPDDFAESFATYVHVVLMKKPWEIRIERKGSQSFVFGPCWNETRCREKRRYIESLLGI